MTTGIYALYWEDSDSVVYIGQSISIEKRLVFHKWSLKAGSHSNYKMQKVYNTTGVLPKLVILEEANQEHLDHLEDYWIKEFNSIREGYNIIDVVSVTRGLNCANSIYSKYQILSIFRLLRDPKLSYLDISSITDTTYGVVNSVSNKVSHVWVHEKYPNLSKKLFIIKAQRSQYTRGTAHARGKSYTIVSPLGVLHNVTNISEFSRSQGLNLGNLANVLYGNAKTVDGWHLPGYCTKIHRLVSPSGEVFIFTNIKLFCSIHKLDSSSIGRVLSREYKSSKGWVLEK